MHPLVVLGALTALAAALFATFIGWLTKVNICDGNSCQNSLFEAQFLVALVGLAPAGALLYATLAGYRRLATLALAAGVITYAVWGLLNNLAVHGSAFGG